MYNYHNRKKFICSIFLILLLAIGIGYAYLTSNLSISGNTQVTTNTWNIHFENIQVKDGSVTATTSPTLSNNNTSITYTIDLNRPKEYYEFTVDVKNDGTLPGKVSISSLSGLDTTSSKIIDYSIKYTNGNPVKVGDILNAGAKKTIKVRTFYKDEIDPTDFPATDLNLTLTYTLQYVQSEEDEVTIDNIVQNLINNDTSCFIKYSGDVTDQVGVTKSADNVYYDRCFNKRHLIFNNMCFQMIRTTETGGVKIIYSGEPGTNGKCGIYASNHKGIVQLNYNTYEMNSNYLYGSSFTYDISTNEFTLVNTFNSTWSDSTYESLLGKFTCKDSISTCSTLYQINSYDSNTNAYLSNYQIENTNYAQIGTSSYNANFNSLAMFGYMFNKTYNSKTKSISSTTKFGSAFTYANGTYTLSGTTQNLTALSSSNIANIHYTCWNAGGSCTNISYVYYISSSTGYYIEISDGKSVTDAVNEMLYNDNVNMYNSSIKGIIDNWYAQYLSDKTNMLEDTVYCNARNMYNESTNGWNPNGGNTSIFMRFKNDNYMIINDISCINETDQFSVSNNKAKLTYPVALATHEELYTLTDNNNSTYYDMLTRTDYSWWGLSPEYFYEYYAVARYVYSNGNVYNSNTVANVNGIRPVISLKNNNRISSGSGSESDPWIIME